MYILVKQYLLDKLFSISAHITDSVPVHGEVSLKCFMFFQQALMKTNIPLFIIIYYVLRNTFYVIVMRLPVSI